MTLGNAAAARVRLIVWCKAYRHQVEPDAAEMAGRYGANTTVPEVARAARLLPVRQPRRRHGGDRDRAAVTESPPYANLPVSALDPKRPFAFIGGNAGMPRSGHSLAGSSLWCGQ
jgi:hypothetical protein